MMRRIVTPLVIWFLYAFQNASAFSAPHVKVSCMQISSSPSETKLSLISFGKKKEVVKATPGVGDEGCALPSPSGINTLPTQVQALVFFGIYLGLGAGTALLSSFLGDITSKYEWVQTWRYSWPLLGAIFAAAGVSHFTLEDEFCNTYPSKGAWGFWYLPFTPKFHVQWTGVAEILFGLGLVVGGLYDAFAPVYTSSPNIFTEAGIGSDSAAALFLLTLAVTPANIYMYTHGAKLPMDGPEIPVAGHAIRGVLQIVLLALFYQMGEGTFDAILN